ncbi:uncharacterized protein MEPE_03136 [Melanopsichium pennsylvanicum]|uniref:Uncharacterized protein n=2 Tax=Melanopsichium pennsylvanicum TaxID=63383 RepID=A0AAJ4XLD3_9BASI|nr:hypothetical protein BN887_01791 [Melanopsichium pennsylvanicum 4]SNX84427.1 uncharacterized protein MEPE_03136 [Melanopsichium pennsylvanicum]
MTDWSSPVVIGQGFYAATALMWLCIGIYAYDTLQYLPFDLSILLGQRQRRWPQLPYLFSKLCMWSYLITNIVFVLTNTEINCNGTLQAVEMQMGWIATSSSVLLAFRAVCVYTGKARTVVSVVLTIMTLGLLAAWMEGVKDAGAGWISKGGNPWQDGACSFTFMSKQYAIKYIVTIVFDFVVMMMTIVGVIRMNGGSRIGQVLVKQGLQYFLATFLINALVAGLTLANLNPVMSLIGAIPSATVCVMCSTRLYVHLAEEAKPKLDGVNSSQLGSSFSGSGAEKIARFFKRSSHKPNQAHPSYALGATSINTLSTCTNDMNLSYTVKNGSHSPVDAKSFATGSHDDLEAQQRGHKPFVNIVEEKMVVREEMPEHLVGVLSEHRDQSTDLGDHPYVTNGVKGHFPRLSKS